MTEYKISLIPGDGIGPELSEATLKVLQASEKKFGLKFKILECPAGDIALETLGAALPAATVETIKGSHACMKGPVGESAADVIVKLRYIFDLYANLRPIKTYPAVEAARPNIDMMFVCENTEDVYKGLEFTIGNDTTLCLRVITRQNSTRIAKKAFEMARLRNGKKKVTAIQKPNVIRETSGLFLREARAVAKEYPGITLKEGNIDAVCMWLLKNPLDYGVIVTSNMFGDILSDLCAQLVGGLGFASSGNIGDKYAVFEPTHGSAPKYAGQRKVNPMATLLSVRLMLDWLGETERARTLEAAVARVIADAKVRTYDMGGSSSTLEVAKAVAALV